MTAPVTIRRHGVVTGWRHQTGWRWTCRTCPPIRGRARAGFHHDHRFTDYLRPGRYPNAWTRCLQAALLHVHVHHQGPPPTRPMSEYPTVSYRAVGA